MAGRCDWIDGILNNLPGLLRTGGNIGYSVRPDCLGRGYAGLMLGLKATLLRYLVVGKLKEQPLTTTAPSVKRTSIEHGWMLIYCTTQIRLY